MINYRKGKNVEEELTRDQIPIENLPTDFLWMHVKGGTKVSNVIDYAKNEFKTNGCRTVVWSGSGGGVGKTISCAEIMKRDMDALHQVTRLCYRKVEEYWDPILDGLEPIVATRQIPCVHVMLTLDAIEEAVLGHQHSKSSTPFWVEHPEKSTHKSSKHQNNQSHKRSQGRGNGQQQQQRQNTEQHEANRPSGSGIKKSTTPKTSNKTSRDS